MNERIQELRKQASAYFWSLDNDAPVEEYDKKFAELIVKDCIDKLEECRKEYASPGTYESTEYYERMAAKEYAMEEAINRIKYDFGVEE